MRTGPAKHYQRVAEHYVASSAHASRRRRDDERGPVRSIITARGAIIGALKMVNSRKLGYRTNLPHDRQAPYAWLSLHTSPHPQSCCPCFDTWQSRYRYIGTANAGLAGAYTQPCVVQEVRIATPAPRSQFSSVFSALLFSLLTESCKDGKPPSSLPSHLEHLECGL